MFAGEPAPATLLVKGEDLIAHVHQEFYAAMFSRAEDMRNLLVTFCRKPCDLNAQGIHASDCRTCAARKVLLQIDIDEARLLGAKSSSLAPKRGRTRSRLELPTVHGNGDTP
jgi:hypothetical protein